MALLQLVFLAAIFATSYGSEQSNIPFQIHLLMPRSGSAGRYVPGLNCKSWRLAVETNNIKEWTTVPEECANYVGHYMLGKQYKDDYTVVTEQAFIYAKSLNLTGDGKDAWVFDIDETVVTSIPYYAENNFGADPYNSTSWNEWVLAAKAPALPASRKLYEGLLALGFKIIFLTGRNEDQREATATNLKNVGYHTWEKLILKSGPYLGATALYYKSSMRTQLVKQGYRILGNIGDQWSDLLGDNGGNRTFKMPDPMYYLS